VFSEDDLQISVLVQEVPGRQYICAAARLKQANPQPCDLRLMSARLCCICCSTLAISGIAIKFHSGYQSSYVVYNTQPHQVSLQIHLGRITRHVCMVHVFEESHSRSCPSMVDAVPDVRRDDVYILAMKARESKSTLSMIIFSIRNYRS
jgi:hypothetical protein